MELQEELKKMMTQIQSQIDPQAKAGRQRVSFEWHPVEDHEYFKETGIKRFKDEVFIKAYAPGSKSQTHRKVTEQDKRNFPSQWMSFLAMEGEEGENGFPITQWYACTKGQAATLVKNGVKTVESLAALEPDQIKRFGQEYPDLRNAAIAHIEKASNSADLNKLRAQNDMKDETISSLKRKVKALEKKLSELEDAKST